MACRNGLLVSALYGGDVLVWDPQKGEMLHRLEGHREHLTNIVELHDGTVATFGGDEIRQWDIAHGRCLCVVPAANFYGEAGADQWVLRLDQPGDQPGRRLEIVDLTRPTDSAIAPE